MRTSDDAGSKKVNLTFQQLLLLTRVQLRAALYRLDVHSLSSDKERTKKADQGIPLGTHVRTKRSRRYFGYAEMGALLIFLRKQANSDFALALGSPSTNTEDARKQECKNFCHLRRTLVHANFEQNEIAKILALSVSLWTSKG